MGTLTAPIRQSGLDSDSMLLAAQFAEGAVMENLVERFDVFDTGAIRLIGDVEGSQSDTLRVRFMNVGWALSMDATANETTAITPSDVTDDTSDVVVARRAKGLSWSQFAQIVGGRIVVDPDRLAASLTDSFRRGRMGALITTLQSFSTTAVDGSAYNDADDLFTIMDYAAAAGVQADTPIYGLIKGSGQWNKIRDSLRSEVGPVGYRPDVIEAFGFKPAGLASTLFDLRIFVTDRISASASKYTGAFWVPGAVGYAIGSTRAVLANSLLRDPGIPCVVSWKEKPDEATIEMYGNAYDGSGILEEVGWLFKGKE